MSEPLIWLIPKGSYRGQPYQEKELRVKRVKKTPVFTDHIIKESMTRGFENALIDSDCDSIGQLNVSACLRATWRSSNDPEVNWTSKCDYFYVTKSNFGPYDVIIVVDDKDWMPLPRSNSMAAPVQNRVLDSSERRERDKQEDLNRARREREIQEEREKNDRKYARELEAALRDRQLRHQVRPTYR